MNISSTSSNSNSKNANVSSPNSTNSFPKGLFMATTSTMNDTSNNNEKHLSDHSEMRGNLCRMMRNQSLVETSDFMMASGSGHQMSDEAAGFSTKYLEELEAALGVSREQLHQEQTRLLQEERDAVSYVY